MKNLKETKKLNNKGFSLVELIIVVAIMAVLIGVLAPQYLKYVEKSRESADLDNYQAIISALEIYAADSANAALPGGTITFPKNASANPSDTAYTTALNDAGVTLANVKMKSEKYSHDTAGTANAELNITVTDGIITFTTNNTALNAAIGQ